MEAGYPLGHFGPDWVFIQGEDKRLPRGLYLSFLDGALTSMETAKLGVSTKRIAGNLSSIHATRRPRMAAGTPGQMPDHRPRNSAVRGNGVIIPSIPRKTSGHTPIMECHVQRELPWKHVPDVATSHCADSPTFAAEPAQSAKPSVLHMARSLANW